MDGQQRREQKSSGGSPQYTAKHHRNGHGQRAHLQTALENDDRRLPQARQARAQGPNRVPGPRSGWLRPLTGRVRRAGQKGRGNSPCQRRCERGFHDRCCDRPDVCDREEKGDQVRQEVQEAGPVAAASPGRGRVAGSSSPRCHRPGGRLPGSRPGLTSVRRAPGSHTHRHVRQAEPKAGNGREGGDSRSDRWREKAPVVCDLGPRRAVLHHDSRDGPPLQRAAAVLRRRTCEADSARS
mmetsp:Transcript_9356/g.17077  ORF Transcript_9356/g.17077 Transcript_9356/m.17077 type:complete len:239 (-) Transcript_9356:802-1518(-)